MKPGKISFRGYYMVCIAATLMGIIVVFLLNLATPLGFFASASRLRLGSPAVGSFIILLVAIHLLMRPLSAWLSRIREGSAVEEDCLLAARARLLNLPFMFIGVNVGIWIALPALMFLSAHLLGQIDFKAAVVLAVRASMVGFVASAVGFFGIEAVSRRELIPVLFPEGHLAAIKGVARISISRRIRMLYRMGSMVPMTILVVTLFTLQWEVKSSTISAEAYGHGILIFTLMLVAVFFVTTGIINRLATRSIVQPLEEMLAVVPRIREGDFRTHIRVVSNDEIGVLGDAGNAMIRGLTEREILRDTFGRYVTPEIRDEILAGRIPLAGERREATVLFADLRGFTAFVENNAPEEVISTMRSYFTAMHGAIRSFKGLVLQFVGDEVEAVFGVPVQFEDHAESAVQAALQMEKALSDLNRDRAAQGKPPLAHGIGIHSGTVLAGNTGSEEQSAYALIGDTVNIASRIQDLTQEFDCTILASQETVKRLKLPLRMDQLPARRVKGYSKPVAVYRIHDSLVRS